MTITAESVWNECLSFIKDNIKPQAYKTWFEPISAVKLTENALSIQVPSKFFYEWLEEHYVKILKVALTKELGESAKLVYVIKMENTYGNKQPFTEKIPSSNRSGLKSQNVDVPFNNKSPELKNPFVIPGIRNVKIESQLNPSYSFENFLEGDSNRLARNAGLAVANKPGGTSFNPLLIFGGVGLGKTHLAHAIGVDIKDKYPEKTVLYISAEKFTQQYIDSVKSMKGDIASLSRYRRQVGVLKAEREQLLKQVDSLTRSNTMIAMQRDSTYVELEKQTVFNDSLVVQNTQLADVVEKGSALNLSKFNVDAVKERGSGKLVSTSRAKRTDKFKICFTLKVLNFLEDNMKHQELMERYFLGDLSL